jgi:DNA-binding winged helix-turn-helix (wHTH) protein
MAVETPIHLYEFDCFHLDPNNRHLLRDGQSVSLKPKEFDLLLALVEHMGQILTYDRLKERVWPDSHYVQGKTIHQTAHALRHVLGDSAREQKWVRLFWNRSQVM